MHKLSLSKRLHGLSYRQQVYVMGASVFLTAAFSSWLVASAHDAPAPASEPAPQVVVADQLAPPVPAKPIGTTTETPAPKAAKKPTTTTTAPVAAQTTTPMVAGSTFMFGVGTELNDALAHRITREAPVKMMSSWYNGPKDLGFMSGWRTTLIPQATKAGKVMHLIVYSNDPEQNLTIKYGAACGRAYPVSSRLVSDMKQLATIFKGSKLYVSMFTELQTYPCQDNNYKGSENYYKALKDNYRAAVNTFHTYAPGSQVSLTWGGWLTNWDDPGNGGGKSLLKYFTNELNASDFQSFQAMANHSNLSIVRNMTTALKPYRGKTMVAHYKPDGGSQTIFNDDMRTIFTSTNMASLRANELFAFSFMDTANMNSSESAYQTVKKIIKTYAK